MNEEDKKTIEYIKSRLYGNEGCDYIDVSQEVLKNFVPGIVIENIEKDFIPVQKVKDKIEEEKLPLTIVGGRNNKKTLEYGIKLGKRQALQELLEGRK